MTPFLWKFLSKSVSSTSNSGGEERPHTASLAEESRHMIVEFDKT